MNAIKRFVLSITAQANRIVDDFEDHEAVAAAAIRQLADLTSRTALQLRRVETEIETMDREIQKLSAEETLWARRAVQEQSRDQRKALECTRRLLAVRQALGRLRCQHQNAPAVRRDIQQRHAELQAQLSELKQKRHLLSARQNQVDAATLAARMGNASDSLTDVFARWETRIATDEGVVGDATPVDVFAAGYTAAEEEAELVHTLNALVAEAANPASDAAG